MNAKAPLITLVLIMLVGFATYFFFLGPQFQRQSQLESEKQNLQQQETTLQTQINMLKDLQTNQVRTRARLNRISSFLPDGPDQPGFLASMQMVADSASVEVTEMTFGEPSDVPDIEPINGLQLSQMTVSTNVKGDYFRLIDFLRRIEFQLGRAMITSSVNLAPGNDDKSASDSMAMTMESTMYFYRPAGTDNPSAAPSAQPSDGASASPGPSAAATSPSSASDASNAPTSSPSAPATPSAGGQ